MRVTEDMRRRAVDALDACRHSGQPWFKLLVNEVVEIALNAALAPWRTNTTSSFRPSDEEAKPEPDAELEDCYRAAVGSGAEPRKPGDAAAAVRELAKQYDELLTAFPWRERVRARSQGCCCGNGEAEEDRSAVLRCPVHGTGLWRLRHGGAGPGDLKSG